jgi:hypothetical protein
VPSSDVLRRVGSVPDLYPPAPSVRAQTAPTTLGPFLERAGLGVVWVGSRGARGARGATGLCLGTGSPHRFALAAARTAYDDLRTSGEVPGHCSGCTGPMSCADGVLRVGARSISARSRRGAVNRGEVRWDLWCVPFVTECHRAKVSRDAAQPRPHRARYSTPTNQGRLPRPSCANDFPGGAVPAIGTERVPSVLRLR